MTSTALDKRLRQLEKKVPELPCPIPEYNRALVFIGVSHEKNAAK
jgi:hypothetical protein